MRCLYIPCIICIYIYNVSSVHLFRPFGFKKLNRAGVPNFESCLSITGSLFSKFSEKGREIKPLSPWKSGGSPEDASIPQSAALRGRRCRRNGCGRLEAQQPEFGHPATSTFRLRFQTKPQVEVNRSARKWGSVWVSQHGQTISGSKKGMSNLRQWGNSPF